MPLVLGDAGCEYDIKKIGGNDEVRTRLSAMKSHWFLVIMAV